MTTSEIIKYIELIKDTSKKDGNSTITLIAKDIHKELKLKNRFPMVCSAMYQCMSENDVILHTTSSGFSSTIEIEYKL